MKLVKVETKKDKKDFLDVARIIYKNDPHWVCPLDSQINGVFNPEVNVFFQHGKAARWILKDDNDKLIGRVAAFINDKKAWNYEQPTGGMGFFECINDQEAAFMLFDQCKQYLSEHGMEAMDGPINFGENDNFWGLLVEGFSHPGYGMQYHLPYYKDLFENYGFQFYFEQVSNHLDLTKDFPDRFWKIANWVKEKRDYKVIPFRNKDREKFIEDFAKVYDDAWSFHENFTPINKEDIRHTLKQAKPIIIEEFILFVYDEGEPIAFVIMFPDINQILKYMNGKMHLWNKIRFLYYKWRKTINRSRIVILGVRPKYQKSGVESIIFWHMDKIMKQHPWFKEIEMSWVGDFNPKMRQLHESVGGFFGKRHITYRYLFKDPHKEQRSTIIPMDTKEKAIKGQE
jgi:hypothetical protein